MHSTCTFLFNYPALAATRLRWTEQVCSVRFSRAQRSSGVSAGQAHWNQHS